MELLLSHLGRLLQDWGAAGAPLLRTSSPAYGDGLATPAGEGRPSPRAISNAVLQLLGLQPASDRDMSSMVYAWGQVPC